MPEAWRARLASLPRMGWVTEPSPVQAAPAALVAGRTDVFLKRDDLLRGPAGDALPGGTKIRKLDTLLAAEPWREAALLCSVGAIGSGQLVALSAAARLLGRRLRAHLFWQPPLPSLLENLAYVASGPVELTYSATRPGLALRHPRALLGLGAGGAVNVPPGASAPLGEAGVLAGALELADQVAAGACPAPAHVFVPLGSGGTVVGLWLGLALAGLPCTLHAVATVERIYSPRAALVRRARALIGALGLPAELLSTLLAGGGLVIHREALGAGYGIATPASLAASQEAAAAGVPLEPIYSGKAMDALRRLGPDLRGPVLFWSTPRRAGPLEAAADWRDRLPRRLRSRLDAEARPAGQTRRRVLLGAAGLALVAGARHLGYPAPPDGLSILPAMGAATLRAACEAVLSPPPDAAGLDDCVRRIDRFVATQPPFLRLQVLGALDLVEQAGPLLGAHLSRFSGLSVGERRGVLDALARLGGVPAEAGRAVRDLAVLGHYQRPESFKDLGYGGPWVGAEPRKDVYAALTSEAPPPGFTAATAGGA